MIPKFRKFKYDGIDRVVIEREVDSRPGAGMYCLEVMKDGKPSNKNKTFKPGKMMDSRPCSLFERLYYTARSVRVG